MDLLDLAILALRITLVVALYVFLVLVLRLAGRGLQARPRPAPAPRPLERGPLTLIVVDGGGSGLAAGATIKLDGSSVLGRNDRADVVLVDAAVSGSHARLDRLGQAWVVTDLGSTNGTRLNDQTVPVKEAAPLADGDLLELGKVRLRVQAR